MKREDLRRTFKLTPHEKAIRQLIEAAHIKPLDSEQVTLERSVGRVLAMDITSDVNIPRENRAVFDGYAIQSTNTLGISVRNPVKLKIVGKSFPGDAPNELTSGQTVFTACGAPLPKGADAIVKAENVRLLGDEIEVRSSAKPGENIAHVGEDVEKGRQILKKGHILRPQDMGLLAGLGMRSAKLFKKPKVGIISVGDELVKLSRKNPRKIANNYALIVSSLASEFGAIPRRFDIVPDNLERIKKAISKAVEEMDIVATISGCSVGPKDLVPDAINALGKLGLVFHGVKLSPGKVMGAGIVKDRPVIMLPGHIVSTYAGFYLLIAPLIAQYLGLGKVFPLPVVGARITQDVKAKPTAAFLRVNLTRVKDEFEARPVHGGSGVLATLIHSNGYTIVPRGKGLTKGMVVNVVLFSRFEFAHIMPS